MTLKPSLVGLATTLSVSAAMISTPCIFAAADNWSDSIKVSGDFRYRLENIDDDRLESRDRSRLRARINFDAKVNDEVKVGIRLASGDDDPVSSNQSFDGFASTKGFGLDRAFVVWTPVKGSSIIAGKMAMPFYRPNKAALLWDSDLNPEGIAYKYSANGFFASAAHFSLDECGACDDSYLNGVQAGYSYEIVNDATLTFGLGQYAYDLNEVETVFPDLYNETEFFADYSAKFNGTPFIVYVNYVTNSDGADLAAAAGSADALDSAYELGFKYGKVKDAGSWDAGYIYKTIDAFSVFPAFTDSDFAGGGTDGEGHILKFGYGVSENFSIGLSYFINETEISTVPVDYNRTQLDFKFKF